MSTRTETLGSFTHTNRGPRGAAFLISEPETESGTPLEQEVLPDPSFTGLVALSSLRAEQVSWLWDGRLPLGKVVVIDGDPATGKSTLTLDIAARVSTGRAWPDGASCRRGGVLLLSAEDGLEDTIVPRLDAAGADRSMICALSSVPIRGDDGEVKPHAPVLPRDIPYLRTVITSRGIRLVVVDVLMAYLNGKVDSYRDQDVRGVLSQLAALAEDTGCTIVLLRHLNKAGGSNALYRGGGSIGIVGAARSAFLVARDPDDPDLRYLAVTKSNLGPEPPTLAYRLVATDLGCARVEWEAEPVPHTAAQLLSGPVSEDEKSERNECADWLSGFLLARGGSAPAADVRKAANIEGLAWRTVQRARDRAGVISERGGFQGGSLWSIRDTLPPIDAIDDNPSDPGTTGTNGVVTGTNEQQEVDPDAVAG